MKNYYGRLCMETYEALHAAAPEDELAFYLSYARAGDKILEPMCGSGRFLIPFMERGFDITGIGAVSKNSASACIQRGHPGIQLGRALRLHLHFFGIVLAVYRCGDCG